MRITAAQFMSGAPLGWTCSGGVARARFATGSFAAGVRLVVAIGAVADEMNHHPDVLLRYGTVTVEVTTHDAGGLSDLDVDLATRISALAAGAGISAIVTDPIDPGP